MLSRDEILKKWRKNKPLQVRFVVTLLLCIPTSPLLAYTSADINCGEICSPEEEGCIDQSTYNSILGSTEEEKCKNVSGCKYESSCMLGDANSYTFDGQSTSCSTSDSEYTKSAAGSWNQNQCYKSINLNDDSSIKCRQYRSGTVVCATSSISSCNGPWGSNVFSDGFCNLNTAADSNNSYAENSTNLSPAHTEGNAVYLNERACSLFVENSLYEYVSLSGTPVFGNAQYNGSNWTFSNCKAMKQVDTMSINNDPKNCSGLLILTTNSSTSSVSSGSIHYTRRGFFCTKCKPGYGFNYQNYARYDFYVSENECGNSHATISETDLTQQRFVCKCPKVMSGYYSSGVQICDANSVTSNGDITPCKITLSSFTTNDYNMCPVGKTSGGTANWVPQPVDNENKCFYSAGDGYYTKFCDAFGCFKLSPEDGDWMIHDSDGWKYNWDGNTQGVN